MLSNKILTPLWLVLGLLIWALLSPAPLFANDTILGESGHTVYPINTDKIRMVSEKIKVELDYYPVDWSVRDLRKAIVTCEFWFENTAGEEIEATVGFPGNDFFWGPPAVYDLKDFKAHVDGTEVPVRTRKEVLKYYEEGPDGERIEDYRYWYTWDVKFPPKKRMKILNTYWVTPSSNQRVSWFRYVLTTGANWKGPIERAEVEVIYGSAEELKDKVLFAWPKGYEIKGDRIVWVFTDFKPEENISILEEDTLWDLSRERDIANHFIENLKLKGYEAHERLYTEEDLAIETAKADEMAESFDKYLCSGMKYYDKEMGVSQEEIEKSCARLSGRYRDVMERLFIRVLRNEIFARHGRQFESRNLNDIFGKLRWYKPDPDYSDDMLNDYERKNIEFIVNYEAGRDWRKQRAVTESLSPKEVVEKFCQLDADGQRLRGDTWREKIRPLILWPEEPGWDTVAVISDFSIVDVKTEGSEATVTVEYFMLGTTDSIDFYKSIKKKTVKFSLLNVDGVWKINQPDMMLPHVSIKTIIKHLQDVRLEEPVIKEQLARIIQKILEAE